MKDYLKALIVGLCVIVAVGIVSLTYFNRSKADDVVSVTGLGSIDFDSDLIVWRGETLQYDRNLEKAYEKLNADREKIRAYLLGNKIGEAEISFYAVEIGREYKDLYNSQGQIVGNEFSRYVLRLPFKIESVEIDRLENVSRNISELIEQGLELQSFSPDYFNSKLADLKIELVAKATQDARARAQKIAENSGSSLGKVRYSNLGVIQITERNSPAEASWEGAFDTKARYKTASLTVRVQFELR